jgi:hypothetical protein
MGNLRKPKDWTEEERQNVVNVFAWLLKEDKKQNPHLYKKNAKTSEINKDNREKLDKDGVSIMSENS